MPGEPSWQHAAQAHIVPSMGNACAWRFVAEHYTPLVVLHAVAALFLVGAATHNGLLSLRALRGQEPDIPQLRSYASIIFWTYVLSFAIGMLIYPPFRVEVRAAWLDVQAPMATALFEIKEHWLGLGLGMLLYHYGASRRLTQYTAPTRTFLAIGVLLMLITWQATVVGLTLTAMRPG